MRLALGWGRRENVGVDGDLKRISKTMSLVLRHRPEKAGITLDPQGWVPVAELLEGLASMGLRVAREILERVVAENDKQRFEFDPEGLRIRARQGHSVSVELGLAPVDPPAELFHGTPRRNLERISAEGLVPRSRHHVHLSSTVATAREVGRRRDADPAILRVAASAMQRDGHEFFVTENGVWLTAAVPPECLAAISGDQ